MKMFSMSVAGVLVYLFTSLCLAQPVELKTASGHVVIADYLPGNNNRNPVILLHGFLQTRQFPTVARLATTLHESGYTVLNPSLSFGISNRDRSLSCEAIHTHSLESDADELGQWINWVRQKTGKPVTLIGHSSAGPVILQYMMATRARHVNQAILVSLYHYSSGPAATETPADAAAARRDMQRAPDMLGTYALGYCKTYPTYPRHFLSYYRWDRHRVKQAVEKFPERIAIIIGTGDKRIDPGWLADLENSNYHVIAIEGANHFFDQAHEFDLADAIEQLLSNNH